MVLGLDVGGSKTRARLAGHGDVLDVEGGSASLSGVGPGRAWSVLDGLVRELLAARPGPVEAACAGMAGVDGPLQVAQAHALLRRLLPGVPVLVVNDARLVLAAAGVEEGVALVAGTGSIAYGLRRGAEARAGGWGHLLGDEGGGYWLVREAVRHLLERWDRGLPPGRLQGLLDATGCTDPSQLLHAFHRRPEAGTWARHASLVLNAVPTLATAAGEELADLAVRVCTRLGLGGPVVLAGGLLLNRADVRRATVRTLRRRLDGVEVRCLEEPPVAGAVILAARLISS